MDNKSMTAKEQAMSYHANGFSVIPCGLDKRPALPSWKPYQSTQATDEQILEWFSKSEINIGIVTGKISGITVVDIDNKGDKGQARADLMLAKFPATYTVLTPSGGYHFYYQ